jgi:hypothetical protein
LSWFGYLAIGFQIHGIIGFPTGFCIDKLLKIQYLLNYSRVQGSKVHGSFQGPLLFTLNAFIIGRTDCKVLKETAMQAYTIHPPAQ